MNSNIIQSFNEFWLSAIKILPDLLVSLSVLIVFILLGRLVHKIFLKRIQNKWKDSIISSFLSEFVKWTFYFIGLTFALFNIGLGGFASSLLAGAGITAIIIGFAFKDIAENFLAGILLAINRPFDIGDIIQVGEVKGPVKGLDLRTTQIKTVDGRDIYIPNSMVIKNIFTNYTRDGLLRLDFQLGLDTYDDIEKAREMIIAYLLNQEDIIKEPLPNVTLEELGESSVTIRIMFWIDIFSAPKNDQSLLGETIRSRVMRQVRDLIIQNGFNMPAQIIEHKMYQADKPLRIKIMQ